MKILIISAYFPPYNAIGSLRIGKLAKFLLQKGFDVRVISAHHDSLSKTLEVEVPLNKVHIQNWTDIHSLPRKIIKKNNSIQSSFRAPSVKIINHLYDWFRAIFHWPDQFIFWYFPAKRAGASIIKEWRPDIIYASAWPITSLIVASSLSKKFSIPWVAELRDLWLDNHYYKVPVWRRWLDLIFERRLLRSANHIVTVSEPLAETLRKKFDRPTSVVLNGFDPLEVVADSHQNSNEFLTISYTGMIYPGRRDPTPLFEALKALGPLAKKKIRVKFYGRYLAGLTDLIQQFDLSEIVELCAPVPHREAIAIQKKSDILLLLLWNSNEEIGVFTGKLFEYIGALRPILSLGLESGVAADLIRDRNAGFVSNSAELIRGQLKKWIQQKDELGVIPPLSKNVGAGLTRNEQYEKLIPIFIDVKAIHSRKKVLVVTKGMCVGGCERHLLATLPELKDEYDIKLILMDGTGELVSMMESRGINVIGPSRPYPRSILVVIFVANLIREMLSNKDLLIHFFLPEPYIIGGITAAIVGHKYLIMSRRSLNIYQSQYFWAAKIERWLHGKMNLLIGNSKAVLEDLRKEGVPESKMALIYNGINPNSFQPSKNCTLVKRNFGLSSDDFVILVVANLISYKGHKDLIEALYGIDKKLPKQWKLLIVGRDEGEKNNIINSDTYKCIHDKVLFMGEVINIEDIYHLANISVLPSHQEGFSNSILEGMSASLAMVVTNVGGNTEAVLDGQTGIVVPPHSPKLLGEAILRLALNPSLSRKMGIAARDRVVNNFSISSTKDQYANLYKSILL